MFGIAIYRDCKDVLCECAKDFICFPNVNGQRRNQLRFREKYGLPKFLGCVDGTTHIPIVAPSTNQHLYVNRKGYHSINVQAIYDAEFRFIHIVVKWPGSTHDAFIWRQSGINQMINSGEITTINGLFLGDSGYPLSQNLMTPTELGISSATLLNIHILRLILCIVLKFGMLLLNIYVDAQIH